MAWWSRHSSARDEIGIVSEVSRFLSGRCLDSAFCTAEDIPAWAWLSVVAHGDSATLERSARWMDEHRGARPELDNWGRVLQYTSCRLLQTADTLGCSVIELQRQLLVPLELAVCLTPVGPATMYRLVNALLTDVRSKAGIEQS
jgi:hypothetical protein